MDYFIVTVATLAGLAFHWWLYRLIHRWMDRDLALSIAAGDPAMQNHLLECLEQAKRQGIPRRNLEDLLHQAAKDYLQHNH